MSTGSTHPNKPGSFTHVGTSGNIKLRGTMTQFIFRRFPPSLPKQLSPQLSSEARAVPFKPSTSPSSSWMKYSVSTTFPPKQAFKTSALLYRDRRKLRNITTCSDDSYICPVQGNLKYRTIYLHCINCYIEDNTLNALRYNVIIIVGFRLTNFHQLMPVPILHNIWIYSSSAADSSMLALFWMERLMERSDEMSFVLHRRPAFSIIQNLYSIPVLNTHTA